MEGVGRLTFIPCTVEGEIVHGLTLLVWSEVLVSWLVPHGGARGQGFASFTKPPPEEGVEGVHTLITAERPPTHIVDRI